jgi:hypothetical protein
MATYLSFNHESNSDPASEEIDIEEIKFNIISNMHHLIFCDLTIGRSDFGLEPYTSEQVSDFIADNANNIQLAAGMMFASYEEDDDLRSLKHPSMDWFQDFLYEFVTTRTFAQELEYEDDEDAFNEFDYDE